MYAELSWLAQRRKAVRQILDTLLVEMVVTILVLLYMLIMFINLSMGSLDVEAMADVIVAPPPPPPALTPPPPPPSPLDGVKDLAKGWLSGAKDLGAKAATEWRNEYNKLAKK